VPQSDDIHNGNTCNLYTKANRSFSSSVDSVIPLLYDPLLNDLETVSGRRRTDGLLTLKLNVQLR